MAKQKYKIIAIKEDIVGVYLNGLLVSQGNGAVVSSNSKALQIIITKKDWLASTIGQFPQNVKDIPETFFSEGKQ